MKLLKFENIILNVVDYIHDDIFIGFDITVESDYLFDSLLPFLHKYHEDLNRPILKITFDEKVIDGYLGNYIFDKNGNVRLWISKEYIEITTDKLTDKIVNRYSVQYKNLVSAVKQQEMKITELIEFLKQKDILNEDEAHIFKSDFSFVNGEIYDFNHEVNDLHDFLKSTHENLNDIKEINSNSI